MLSPRDAAGLAATRKPAFSKASRPGQMLRWLHLRWKQPFRRFPIPPPRAVMQLYNHTSLTTLPQRAPDVGIANAAIIFDYQWPVLAIKLESDQKAEPSRISSGRTRPQIYANSQPRRGSCARSAVNDDA